MDEREVEVQEGGFGSDDVVNGESSYSSRILHNAKELFAKAKPLGLTITKTQALLSLLEKLMYPPKTSPPSTTEKLKATNFPITSLRIGNWQRKSENEGELIAKLYFAKRKIVWEVLDKEVLPGNELKMKSKIEILWSNITAIQAILGDEDQPGILRIELDKAPLLFRETKPEPKKHTNWESSDHFDFTNGPARTSRIHCVSFPPKVLDKHYENLLQSDQHLFMLSREPFPSQRSPYFQQYPCTTHTVPRGPPVVLPHRTEVMGNSQFVFQRHTHPNLQTANTQISGPPSANPAFHVQMQPMDLVLDPNLIYPNGHKNQDPTDKYCNGHCDAYVQPNNIPNGPSNWSPAESDIDVDYLPWPDDDDDDDDDNAGHPNRRF